MIQSLLLMRQSYYGNYKHSIKKIILNDDKLIRLGNYKDVLSQFAEEESIVFKLIDGEDGKCEVQMQADDFDSPVIQNESDLFEEKMNLFTNKFVYLNAQHLPPQVTYDITNWQDSEINYIGNNGEYVIPWAYTNRNKIVDKKYLEENETNADLLTAINYWMGKISPGIKIDFSIDKITNQGKTLLKYPLKLGNVEQTSDTWTDPYLPNNVGFGITYLLPIVYALLTAEKDSLVILENPESHLHPKGQTEIGRLISLVAGNGVQVICESHSDHLINGIRLSVKERLINNELLSIMFLDKNDSQETICNSIEIDKNGNFDEYPSGFLDQWGNVMVKLI